VEHSAARCLADAALIAAAPDALRFLLGEVDRLATIEAELIATADDDTDGILGDYAARVLGRKVDDE
jgi:hypothetical protein